MTDLVATLGTGKGTWIEVRNLIETIEWDNVYLITNKFGAEKFKVKKNVNFIVINNNDIKGMKDEIIKNLKNVLKLEVGVNIQSGTGNEHMALISALFSLGVGIRLVIFKNNTLAEL